MMKLGKTVGQILKEARTAAKLDIRDVARETNITVRFVEALEEDDWTQFPGEPYAMGFLKAYAEFLKLNPDELISLYKGAQINEMAPPLEELTKSTEPIFAFNFNINMKLVGLVAAVAAGLAGFYFLLQSNIFENLGSDEPETVQTPKDNPFRKYNIDPHVFDQGASTVVLFSKGDGRTLSMQSQDVNILFMDVVDYDPTKPDSGNLILGINFVPETKVKKLKLAVDQPVKISYNQSAYKKLPQDLILELEVLKSSSARLKITKGEIKPGAFNDDENVKEFSGSDAPIVVRFRFKAPSWTKFIVDDQEFNPGTIEAGEVKNFQAANRLEAHIGNAGGVEYSLNGNPYKVLGKSGQAVLQRFVKQADPYDPSKFVIKEYIE